MIDCSVCSNPFLYELCIAFKNVYVIVAIGAYKFPFST